MKNKRTILFCILGVLALALVATALFMPMVHIVGHTEGADKAIVYDKTISFMQYLKDNPFWLTEAGEVYFDATGPIWMATSGILFSVIVVTAGIVLFVTSLTEIILTKCNNLSIKNNVLSKKIAYFVGGLSIFVGIFATVSFIVTTSMANGYAEFYFNIAPVAILVLGIAIVVAAALTPKRISEQQPSKFKNALGYIFVFIFCSLSIVMLFMPMYIQEFIAPDITSIWKSTTLAERLAGSQDLADAPFGVVRFVEFALFIVCAFLIVYSVIGLIRTLSNKQTNWLSSRVKRWSMVLLIVYTLILAIVLCQAAALHSSFYLPQIEDFEGLHLFTWMYYAALFVPYLVYMSSTLISYTKKPKHNKNETAEATINQ